MCGDMGWSKARSDATLLTDAIYYGGNYITMLKDTSVASLIAAPELMMHATDITSEYYRPMPVYLITGAIYFILAYPLSLLAGHLERRAGQSRLRGGLA